MPCTDPERCKSYRFFHIILAEIMNSYVSVQTWVYPTRLKNAQAIPVYKLVTKLKQVIIGLLHYSLPSIDYLKRSFTKALFL